MKVLEYIIRALDKTGDGNRSARAGAADTAKSIMSQMANIKAAWDMGTGAIKAGARAVWSAVREAFKFETFTIQFSVLMGSLSKAKARMKELADFAASTPFQMEEVVTASRQLHVFSDGALGASNSLRLVGDAAAAVGQNIQEVSFWVGRAYSMIKGGQPFGEAAMRLQEMGIITPEVRTKMEELQASGAKNIEVWQVLANRLEQFRGGMNQLSLSGDGLISTLEDTAKAAKKTFGEEFKDAAKTAISSLTEWLNKLIEDGSIKKWAKKTLDVLYQAAGAAKAIFSGDGAAARSEAWTAIKDILIGGLEVGAQKAMDIMEAKAPAIGALIAGAVKAVVEEVVSPLAHAARRDAAIKSLGIDLNIKQDPANITGMWMASTRKRSLTPEEEKQVKARTAEMIRMESLDAAGVSSGKPMLAGQDKLDRGKATLKSLGDRFRQLVDEKTKGLKDAAEAPPDPQAARKKAEEKEKIRRDMAAAQALKDEKEARERAQAEAEERRKLSEKLIADEHKARVEAIREEAQISAQSEANARDRLSRANSAAQQAWGWYRDPESFKRQLAEEKANAAAEKQFAKDFDKLNDRRDWRTTTRLTDSQEAVRRVALAREEQASAQRALLAIERNTAGLESMLKQLLTAK